jgi:hypothetical protein
MKITKTARIWIFFIGLLFPKNIIYLFTMVSRFLNLFSPLATCLSVILFDSMSKPASTPWASAA